MTPENIFIIKTMAPLTKKTSLRLSAIQRSQLQKLAEKLQIDQSNVIRLALTRMAEQEGIIAAELARKHA